MSDFDKPYRVFFMPIRPQDGDDHNGVVVWGLRTTDVGVSWTTEDGKLFLAPWHRIEQIIEIDASEISEDDAIRGTPPNTVV